MGETTKTPHARTIGFRAEPSCLHWAVVDGPKSAPCLFGAGTLMPPRTFEDSKKLSWYVDEITQLCTNRFDPPPSAAWVRTAETLGQQKRTYVAQRARIEGVIIATAKSEGLAVTLGSLVTITAALLKEQPNGDNEKSPRKRSSAKPFLEDETFRDLDWSKYDQNQREAILVAIAALPDEEAGA